MNTVRRVAKNSLLLLTAQIISIALGFICVVYTARYLGTGGFGVLSFALAFTGMLSILSDLGLSQLIVREVARDNSLAEKYMGNAIVIKTILGIFTIFIIILIINLLHYSSQTKLVVVLIGVSLILESLSKIFYSIFQALEKMEFQSIGQILKSVSLLIGTLIAIYWNYNILVFALAYIFASLLNLVYSVIISILKFEGLKLDYGYLFSKNLYLEALPFAITGISINVYLWIDTFMLSVINGDESVGLYNAAYKIVLMLLLIPTIINTSIFPLMSKYFLSSRSSLEFVFDKLQKSMIYIGLPLGVGTVFIADKVISLIYGEQFNNSVIALQILIWSTVLIFMRSPYERLLESINKQAVITKIFILGAIFNVLVNLILIPKYSYIGAGTATLLTDAIVIIFLSVYTKKLGFFISKIKVFYIIKIICSCAIMAGFLTYYPNLNLCTSIVSASIVYIGSSIMLGVFDEDDFVIIKSIFNSRKA